MPIEDELLKIKKDIIGLNDSLEELNYIFAKRPGTRIGSSELSTFKNIQVGDANLQYTIGNQGYFSFGDGSDGDVVISSNTTLTADKYYNNLTVDSGFTLNPGGYRIFVKGTATINGTIARNGVAGGNGNTNGTAGTAGTALADGYLKGSLAGGAGGAGGVSSDGAAGTAGGNTTNSLGSNGSAGGSGGKGGVGGNAGGAAGAGGTATASSVTLIANWHLATMLDVGATGATVKFNNSAAAGGGGGGGNGGQILLVYNTITEIGSLTVTAGTGGTAGTSTGGTPVATAGTDGTVGTIRRFKISL